MRPTCGTQLASCEHLTFVTADAPHALLFLFTACISERLGSRPALLGATSVYVGRGGTSNLVTRRKEAATITRNGMMRTLRKGDMLFKSCL